MAFTHLLGQTPEWKRELLADVRASTGRQVVSYVQVGAINGAEEITPDELAAELRAALSDDVAGIAVFEYDQLVADPVKAAVLRSQLRGRREVAQSGGPRAPSLLHLGALPTQKGRTSVTSVPADAPPAPPPSPSGAPEPGWNPRAGSS